MRAQKNRVTWFPAEYSLTCAESILRAEARRSSSSPAAGTSGGLIEAGQRPGSPPPVVGVADVGELVRRGGFTRDGQQSIVIEPGGAMGERGCTRSQAADTAIRTGMSPWWR